MDSGPSDKSRAVALALAVVLGVFGAHRFYAGKAGSGILMLCTLGGLGIWYLYDVILIAGGSFRDAHGRLVSRWDPEDVQESSHLLHAALDEIDVLRQEVGELSERLDFTERLLTRGPDAGGSPSDP